ncbi:MAG: hypothetical protein ABSE47_08180 [Acidimicrobiales bacterium]
MGERPGSERSPVELEDLCPAAEVLVHTEERQGRVRLDIGRLHGSEGAGIVLRARSQDEPRRGQSQVEQRPVRVAHPEIMPEQRRSRQRSAVETALRGR